MDPARIPRRCTEEICIQDLLASPPHGCLSSSRASSHFIFPRPSTSLPWDVPRASPPPSSSSPRSSTPLRPSYAPIARYSSPLFPPFKFPEKPRLSDRRELCAAVRQVSRGAQTDRILRTKQWRRFPSSYRSGRISRFAMILTIDIVTIKNDQGESNFDIARITATRPCAEKLPPLPRVTDINSADRLGELASSPCNRGRAHDKFASILRLRRYEY